MVVISVSHQALRSPIPSSGDVLSIGVLAVNPLTGPEISQFYLVAGNENILWLDISMENAFFVYKCQSLEKSVHVELNFHMVKIAVIYQTLIQVLFHEFEHECELTGCFIVEYFNELDYVFVGR